MPRPHGRGRQGEERCKHEKKKQIEAKVLQEKQLLLDKQQMLEVLKQKKLLNAYMNHMLVNQQSWLREKEDLYAQLAAAKQEKNELTDEEPMIAKMGDTSYVDENGTYTLLYNSTIGGCFLLYREAIEDEIDWHNDHAK